LRIRLISLAVAASLLLAGCAPDSAPTTDPDTAARQDGAVQMVGMAFAPAAVTITPGASVTWTNDDTVPHTVSFGAGGPGTSETIDPGETFVASFDAAGTYSYVCTLHPDMEGVVEVVEAGAASATGSIAAGADPAAAAAADHDAVAAVTTSVVTAQAASENLIGAGTPGVDVTLGEWALVASTAEAPPGTVTFRFRNLGTVPHALRIRTSGSGKNRLEWRSEPVGPGQSGLLVAELAPGTYDIDCPIEDTHGEHDQLGMEMSFTVHEGAPALAPLPGAASNSGLADSEAKGTSVTIAAFAFQPSELIVPAGTTVAFTNTDPTPHTVTGDGFDTGTLEAGATGALTFSSSGVFEYFCVIHPTMRGSIVIP